MGVSLLGGETRTAGPRVCLRSVLIWPRRDLDIWFFIPNLRHCPVFWMKYVHACCPSVSICLDQQKSQPCIILTSAVLSPDAASSAFEVNVNLCVLWMHGRVGSLTRVQILWLNRFRLRERGRWVSITLGWNHVTVLLKAARTRLWLWVQIPVCAWSFTRLADVCYYVTVRHRYHRETIYTVKHLMYIKEHKPNL